MSIRLPRGYRRQTKAMQNWGELNRWTTDADATITDILSSLGDAARAVERLMNPTAQSLTTLTAHANTHLPAGSDPLATALPVTITADAAAAIGAANAFARSDHVHAIVTDPPAALAAAAAEGVASSFSRSDHVHLFPPALRSTTGTPGDLLTLTSDGANETLTLSRAGADLIFQDQGSVTMARLFSVGGTDRGLWVNGHIAVGQGITAPMTAAIIFAQESYSDQTFSFALNFIPQLDDALIGAFDCANFTPTFIDGFTGSQVVRGMVISLDTSSLSVAPLAWPGTMKGLDIDMRATVPALTPASSVVSAIDIQGAGQTGATTTTAYGLKVAGIAATNAFAASFAGAQVQIATTQKLGFGRAQGTNPTNWLTSKTTGGQIIQMFLASNAIYEFDATQFYPFSAALASLGTSSLYWNNLYTAFITADSTALFPRTSALVGLGKDGNGFLDLWLKDTSAAFENRLVFTSSSALSADRTLTIDVSDGSRTIDLQGNPTLADWFDQDVKTTGTPQFARIGIAGAAHSTIHVAWNDTAAAPTANVSTGLVNRYGGDSNFCGDPTLWLQVRVGGTTGKIPVFT